MKKHILPSLKLTAILILICSVIYPLAIAIISHLAPGHGDGQTISYNNQIVGYKNIGQNFTDDSFFQGRPSAVNYNAAGSGGSNKGGSNADYLLLVQSRIDTFLVHNPTISKEQIPADLITASGSGLDPDISVQAAKVQVPRIAKSLKINPEELYKLIQQNTVHPLFGLFGPEKVNVLELNIVLHSIHHSPDISGL